VATHLTLINKARGIGSNEMLNRAYHQIFSSGARRIARKKLRLKTNLSSAAASATASLASPTSALSRHGLFAGVASRGI